MQRNRLADEVWRAMAAAVIDNRDSWKRAVIEETRLPFSRIRILRRLARRPMTVKQVAEAATVDAPAATVAVRGALVPAAVLTMIGGTALINTAFATRLSP